MRAVVVGLSFLTLAGCNPMRMPPRAPDILVGESYFTIAATEYFIATRELAQVLGYDVNNDNISPQFAEHFLPTRRERLNFLDPRNLQGNSREFSSIGFRSTSRNDGQGNNKKEAFKKFIVTGQQAASMLCRSYVRGLADRDAGIEALKKELNGVLSLVNGALLVFKASPKAAKVLNGVAGFVGVSLEAYEDVASLKPELMTTLSLVVGAQKAFADYYITEDEGLPEDNLITLAAALNAMHEIEHQCSIAGMRTLIDSTTRDASKQLKVENGVVKVTGQ